MTLGGVVSDVVTYNLIIDALCKARAMDKVELFLRQMAGNSVQVNEVISSMVIQHWASGKGQQKCSRNDMTGSSTKYSYLEHFMASLCKHSRSNEAADISDYITSQGPQT
jgi:pentatricopeptide repeat protein